MSRHGCPKVLLSDQGTNFTSKLIKEVNKLLNCKKVQTTTYHPQCNGLVERFNRTLVDMLSSLCSKNSKDWDLYLDHVQFAYRTTVHSSTGYTPFELVNFAGTFTMSEFFNLKSVITPEKSFRARTFIFYLLFKLFIKYSEISIFTRFKDCG